MEPNILSKNIKESIYEMVRVSGGGHAGGSLSMAEILGVLYGSVMNYNSKNPADKVRDRFILSKGHAGMGLYAALAHSGFFPVEDLLSFTTIQSPLMNHPDAHRIPGIEVSTGSLGHGFSIAVGKALAAKMKGEKWYTWCIVGDAESHEGQIWEAALFAAHNRLDNITCIIDNNRLGNDNYLSNTVEMEPIREKWESFGWRCLTVDGHDSKKIENALIDLKKTKKQPTCLIAKTIKGRGLKVEDTPESHYISKKDVIDAK